MGIEQPSEQSLAEKKLKTENLISATRQEFADILRKNLENKTKGGDYDNRLDGITPDFINEQEALFWDKLKNVRSSEECEELEKEFIDYRARTFADYQKKRSAGNTTVYGYTEEDEHHIYFIYFLVEKIMSKKADFLGKISEKTL